MVILLTGPDLYRSHQRLRQLRQAFIEKYDPKGFATTTLSAAAVTPAELRTAVTTGGLFAQRRFVAIDDYAAGSQVSPDELREILKPVATDEQVIVVVRQLPEKKSTRAGRPTKTTSAKSELTIPKAKLEKFPKLSEAQAVSWLVAEAKQRGGAITRPAAERLVFACQGDSWRMSTELDKLLAYGSGKTIVPEMVDTMVTSPFESNVFALTDAVGQRQSAKAVALLHRELLAGTHPLMLIATLASHIRNLMMVQAASDGQSTPAAIAKRTNIHPYVVQKSLAQVQRFSPDELKSWHHHLADMDITLKSTRLDAETLFDLLLVGKT